MFLWFAGASLVIVWVVFRSPVVDYRLVALGAVLPVVEVVTGRPLVLHTLAAPVVLMGVVMLGYGGRRQAQRRLLGVPIGMFLHLVLDGIWSDTALFWWPLTGFSLPDQRIPELDRWPFGLVLEALGALALWWWWRRWRLGESDRRREFFATGHVGRDLTKGEEPAGC